MHLNRVISIAWKVLVKNKFRSLLTMLGVIIGVAAVIIMISVSKGTETTIAERISSLGTNLIFVQPNFSRGDFRGGPGGPGSPGSSGGLVFDDAAAIAQQVQGVAGTAVEQNTEQTVKTALATLTDVELLGTTPDFPTVRDMSLASGRYFTTEEMNQKVKVAVLGSSLATELFGDTPPVGQAISVGNTKLAVIGVFNKKGVVGNTDFDARMYLPIKVVFQKFTPSFFARMAGDRVRLIYVKLDPQASMTDTILQIQLLLARRHNVTLDQPDFTVTTQQDLITTQESTTAAFRSLLAWVAAVSLLVGGIGIMNIMMVSVTERTREIGIRQSVGASPNDIRLQFLTEALLLSLVGGLIGVFVGVGGSYIFSKLGGMRTVVLPGSVLLAFSSAAAVGIFFGYYPANQAAQLDPIEALRHE